MNRVICVEVNVCVRLCACVHACMLDLEGSAANEHLVMGLFRFLWAYITSVCAGVEDSLCVCVCVCVCAGPGGARCK
jgi:hypothetical protein